MAKNEKNNWYEIKDGKYKVVSNRISSIISLVPCASCKYAILTSCYQQPDCGTRYCQDCYDKLDSQYYCEICKIDDPDNFVHFKKTMFLDKAQEREYNKTQFKCIDCGSEIKLSNLLDHLSDCPKRWTLCVVCLKMIHNDDKEKHKCNAAHLFQPNYKAVDKICDDCGKECKSLSNHKCSINWNTGCPYNCTIKNNEELQTHRSENYLKHLDHIWAIVKEAKLDANKKDDDNYKEHCGAIAAQLVETLNIDSDLEALTNELKKLNSLAEDEKNIYNNVKETLSSQLNETSLTSFDGTILWRIDQWNSMKIKARDGTQKSIFSPPFYTSRFGYKMCLRLYPNGDNTATEVSMSLFLVIMKGKYDELLKWPFRQKVTLILLDQSFQSDHIDAFVPTEGQASFSQPRTDMNIPAGSSHFIKFSDMQQHEYVKNDIIFIRCIVDCSDLPE